MISALMLCACGGGGGASGDDGSEGQGESARLLPDDVYFLPAHYSEAELVIEDASYRLQFTCKNPTPEYDAVMGDVTAPPQGILVSKGPEAVSEEEAESSFSGIWEHWGNISANSIHNLRIFRMENGQKKVLLQNFSICLGQRLNATRSTDNTIILTGSVESGQLLQQDAQGHPLHGATITLTYTKALSCSGEE